MVKRASGRRASGTWPFWFVRPPRSLRSMAALHEFGVPYLAEGGRTFFETREVRDLVHLLQAIANPENELALAGVLRSPLVGAGDETLLRMKQHSAHLARSLSSLDALGAASCDAEDLERLRRFAALLASLRRERDDVSPDRLLMRAMDACDYESGLDGRQRANVAKFLVRVRERHSAKPEPLEALLADIEWLRAAAAEAEAPPGDSSDVVRIMTMHKSKGLRVPRGLPARAPSRHGRRRAIHPPVSGGESRRVVAKPGDRHRA